MSDPKRLLGGYATDTLTDAERRELLRAALDDQELFDAVLEEDGLRELLETPGARQEVLEALEQTTRWQRLRSWLVRPATFADLAVLATVLVVGVVAFRVFEGAEPSDVGRRVATQPAPVALSPATLARLLTLPPHQAVPAGLEPEGDIGDAPLRVEPGGTLLLRMSLRGPAHVLVLTGRPDGSAVQVFPTVGEPPALVQAPAARGPAIRRLAVTAAPTPGTHRLRLVVAPIDVDLGGAAPAEVEQAFERLSLADLTYEVTMP